ncbi:TPA: hypothetical protein ACXNDR_001655 [Serratia marcescens]
MKLTTEQFKAEMIEKIAVASGLRARDGRNVVAEAIYAEVVEPLLAVNREAQPVAWEMRYWSDGYNIWGEWERITAEQHAEMSVQQAADNDYEFRVLYDAPPAPKSTNAADWGIDKSTGTPILVYKNCSVIESEQAHYVLSLINSAAPAVPDNLAAAVNRLLDCDGTRGHFSAIRCSDAREEVERLLAQPVNQRYTLPPHVYRELVNCLRDTAVKYQGTQQLREQLSRTLTENGLSAATLEGSSD